MIVLDASALLELVSGSTLAPEIWKRLVGAGSINVPHLIDLEVASSLRRNSLWNIIPEDRASSALRELRDFPLVRHPHEHLLPRIWALRPRFTAYDASYIALAEVLGVSLLTCDKKLSEAGPFVQVCPPLLH